MGAKRWTLARRDGRMQRTGDLCPTCEAKPMNIILERFGKVPRGRPGKREILTPEQIKARARQGR